MNRLSRLTAVGIFLVASGLVAQENVGLVNGLVLKADGTPLAGARVRITAPQLLAARTAISGADGTFRAPQLPPGDYTLDVSADGFISKKATFRLGGGQSLRQELRLNAVSQAGTTVVVTESSASVDKTETKTATNLSLEQLQDLPLGLNAFAALALAPGVAGTATYATIRGGSYGQAQYTVNGISVRDNVTMQGRQTESVLDDLIEDVSVVQSPLNARYGDSSAGFVNVITKSGGNEFHGVLRAKLFAANWVALRPGGHNNSGIGGTPESPSTDDLTRTYEFSLTGPIIKDHLTFTYGTRVSPTSLGTYQHPDLIGGGRNYTYVSGANTPGLPPGIVLADPMDSNAIQNGTSKTTFNEGKLFWQINSNHVLEYDYSEYVTTLFEAGFNTPTPDLAPTQYQSSKTQTYQLAYRGIIGSNQLIEMHYGKKKSAIQFASGPGNPILVNWGDTNIGNPSIDNDTAYYTSGAAADRQPEIRTNETFTLNYNIYLSTGKGSHSIDLGAERHKTVWGTVQNSGGPNGLIYVAQGKTDPAGPYHGGYVVSNYHNADQAPYLGVFGIATELDQYIGIDQATLLKPSDALYANDQWTINNNWTVMGGLRYEKFTQTDGIGERYGSSSISPRFEIKWDIGGDQKRLLNLSYAHFRGNVGERITRSFNAFRHTTKVRSFWNKGPINPATEYYVVTAAEFLNPANYTPYSFDVPVTSYNIDKGFKPEVNHEFTLGYRRAYTNGGSLRTTLIWRQWKDLPNAFGNPTSVPVADPTGTGLPSLTTYVRTLGNDPRSKREYQGLEMEFKYPISKALSLNGNYTFARTTTNATFGDFTAFGGTQTLATAGIFYPQMDAAGFPQEFYMPNGPAIASQAHVVNAWLGYTANHGGVSSVISLLGRYGSGTTASLTNNLRMPTLGTAPGLPGTIPLYYNGRGGYTNPDFYRFDLQYNVEVPLAGKVKFFSYLSINNLFNQIRATTLGRSNGTTLHTYTAGAFATTDRGYSASTIASYGAPNGYTNFAGARSWNIDVGFKF